MFTRCFLVFCVATLCTPPGRLDAQPEKAALPTGPTMLAGTWQSFVVDTKASLRGLCVYDDQIVWASGTQGTIVRSFDQGHTWRVEQVQGAEKLDFRDLHVIDKETVVAMTSGTPARIYRTDNRGESWNVVYESNDPKVFLDSLSFLDSKMGLVMGDPIDNTLFLLKTVDGGQTWSRVEGTPRLEKGEAGFAASGTNMTTWGKDRIFIALGGGEAATKNTFSRILTTDSRLLNWEAVTTPVPRHESGGIFSLVMIDAKRGVAVGGDYQDPERAENHFAITEDGGLTWKLPDQDRFLSMGWDTAPFGYRSCVARTNLADGKTALLAVGPAGTDLSLDHGNSWVGISKQGFHAAQFSPSGTVGWGVGSDGSVSKWHSGK